jgi:hypothetical protein
MPVPASITTYATPGERVATIGAMTPPSLCPIRPTLFRATSGRAARKRTAASTSFAKSAVVEAPKFPVEPPSPRSSMRSTAMPRRVR